VVGTPGHPDERDLQIARNLAEERTIVDRLRAAGMAIDHLYDLNRAGPYPEIVPILIEMMEGTDNPDVKGALAAALGVPWARPEACRPLLDLFTSLDASDRFDDGYLLRWTAADALRTVMDPDCWEDVAAALRDRTAGQARGPLCLALAATRDPRTVGVLVGLLDDPDVAVHAAQALGRLGAPEGREPLERLLASDDEPLRREALKSLKRIAKRHP
jgi:hypothetical protein